MRALRERSKVTLLGLTVACAVLFAGCDRNKAQTNPQTAHPSPPSQRDRYPISLIEFQDLPMWQAVENLARQARLNFFIDPRLSSKPVTCKWHDVTAVEALNLLGKEHGFSVFSNAVTSVVRISLSNSVAFPNSKWVKNDPNPDVLVVTFETARPDIALVELSKLAKISLTVDPKLMETLVVKEGKKLETDLLSIRWEHIKPRQAIAAICENYGFQFVLGSGETSARIALPPTR